MVDSATLKSQAWVRDLGGLAQGHGWSAARGEWNSGREQIPASKTSLEVVARWGWIHPVVHEMLVGINQPWLVENPHGGIKIAPPLVTTYFTEIPYCFAAFTFWLYFHLFLHLLPTRKTSEIVAFA